MSMSHPLADPAAVDELRQACAVLERAERCGHPALVAQAALAVACAYRRLDEAPSAELCLLRALGWARAAHAHDAVVEVLCELCELLSQPPLLAAVPADAAAHARRERLRDMVFEAASRAAHVADASWEVRVLLHVSDVLDRLGDHDDAAALQARAMLRMNGLPAGQDPSLLPALGRLADG